MNNICSVMIAIFGAFGLGLIVLGALVLYDSLTVNAKTWLAGVLLLTAGGLFIFPALDLWGPAS